MSSAYILTYGQTQVPILAVMGADPAGVTTLALDSAYTYNSAGDAVMGTFVPFETGNLTDFWFRVESYSGTWGSTDGVVNVEIREGIVATYRPGSTLVGSFTVTLDGSTTGWIKKSGISIALTKGRLYSIVIADADGGGTNYVTITAGLGGRASYAPSFQPSATTANGFSTSGSNVNMVLPFVATVNARTYSGNTLDRRAAISSTTSEIGGVLIPPEDCTVVGVVWPTDNVGLFGSHSFKLYASGTAPGGTTLKTWTPGASTVGGTGPIPVVTFFDPADWVDLARGTTYRFVVDPAAATTNPRKVDISVPGIDADIRKTWPLQGGWYWTIEVAGPAWSDDTNAVAHFGPILVPRAAGGGLLVHPGMAGGLRG